MRMLRSTSSGWTLPSVKRACISVEESWSRTYLTEAIVCIDSFYVVQALNDGKTDLPGEPTESYEILEEEEYVSLVVIRN